jgi:hypothetical protein
MERLSFGTLASQLPRIGGMATMPSRSQSLRDALPAILPQVERLYLYLDQYDHVPADLAADARIVPLLRRDGERPMGTSGKLLGLRALSTPCLYFCFDDDIRYPAGYVDRMAAALHRHRYRAVVGVHARVFRPPIRSYIRDGRILNFKDRLDIDCVVDELGSGTIAFHSRCIRLDPERWEFLNILDLMLTIEAMNQDVQLVAVNRPAGFMQAIAENQDDSLYREVLHDDSLQTRLLRSTMAHYPGRWNQAD